MHIERTTFAALKMVLDIHVILLLGLFSSMVSSKELTAECFDNSKRAEIIQCCNFPQPIPSHVIAACSKKHLSLSSDHRNYTICMADCQCVNLGFLKAGKIDLKVLLNITTSQLGPNEPQAQDAINRLAEMCVRLIGEQKTAIAKARTRCNALGFAFMKCLGDGVFANCPDKYWSSREICTKYDEGVPFCDNQDH